MKRTATPIENEEKTKKSKQVSYKHLSVNFTGIRDGETLIGCNPLQTSDVEMEVKTVQLYHPIDECPTTLVRDRFKAVEFFAKMSLQEREAWLAENRRSYVTNKENHLHDPMNTLRVRFTRIQSDHFLEKIGEEGVAMLLAREDYIPLTEVYKLFEPKDKVTRANRYSLVLRPQNWCVKPACVKITSYLGGNVLCLGPESDEMLVDTSKSLVTLNPAKETLLRIDDFLTHKCAIVYPTYPALKKDALFQLVEELLDNKAETDQVEEIRELLSPFTPSLLKSLLQKIIRTQCDAIIAPDGQEYAVRPVLLTCLVTLMLHAGSFNPNKQRFVSGLESALKRLAIIICEDSSIQDTNTIALLLACAFIRQQDRRWVPSLAHVKRFFKAALEAHNSDTVYEYKTDKQLFVRHDEPNRKWTEFELCSVILEKLGGMSGDINFLSYLAYNPDGVVRHVHKRVTGIKIPLIHCIDQHSYTNLAHFMSYVDGMPTNTVAPFKELFSRIWESVGSVNGRKDPQRALTMEDDPFVKEVRAAQARIYIQKFCQDENPMVVEEDVDGVETLDFSHTLAPSWLSGLVGPIKVRIGKPKDITDVIVVLRTDDITEMVTIRNPKNARSSNANTVAVDLTPEEKEDAIERAKNLLRKGYPLTHVPPLLPHFKGAKIYLADDREGTKYFIAFADAPNKLVDWDDAIKQERTFPTFEYMGDCQTDAYTAWIDGALTDKSGKVARNADEQFGHVLKRYSLVVLKRLYNYLANCHPTIRLYDISRDGSATKNDVSVTDIGVNHILCAICTLYPACLELGKSTFRVKYGPLLWSIRTRIKAHIDATTPLVVIGAKYWDPVPGDAKSKLYSHQESSVSEMLANGNRAHELYLEVGMGKTAIFMTYMQRLIEKRKMPTYCIYTGPSSALGNARSEFDRFGIPYCDVVTKKKKHANYTDADLVPFKINIIEHDQMRRPGVYVQLKQHAGDMLFIIDEFHRTTCDSTIRSSIALEIARLSAFFIAMTGTIVRNDNPADLISWLELIVEFFVDQHNYLSAFAALISRKASTGVIVNRLDIACEFTPIEQCAYDAIVPPQLGGTAKELNFRAALKICYEAVNRSLVTKAVEYVCKKSEIILVLAQNKAHQERLRDLIIEESRTQSKPITEDEIFLISNGNTITLKPETKTNIRVVITTLMHVCGFTLTKIHTVLLSIYPSNESTRNQFDGRVDRIGQPSPEVDMFTFHCGILSYMAENYKRARTFAAALKEFADNVGLDYRTLMSNMTC